MTLVDLANLINGWKYSRVSGKPRKVSFCFDGNVVEDPTIYIYDTSDSENEASICIGVFDRLEKMDGKVLR